MWMTNSLLFKDDVVIDKLLSDTNKILSCNMDCLIVIIKGIEVCVHYYWYTV